MTFGDVPKRWFHTVAWMIGSAPRAKTPTYLDALGCANEGHVVAAIMNACGEVK